MASLAKHIPLRILMTTDTIGGVWSYSIQLCKALGPFGVHCYLVTTGAPLQPAQRKEAESSGNITIYETDFLLEWMEAPWQSIDASVPWLLQLEEELQPDLIHINGFAYGSLSWKAPVVVVAHSDVWSWWLSVKGGQPPSAWDEYFERVRNGINGAAYLLAPSRWMMNAIQKIYTNDKPAKVIYNGRSREDFYEAKKESFIFCIGRIWDEAKNIKLVIESAPLTNHPIKIAGDNSFGNNSYGVASYGVSWLGRLSAPEVAAQLSAASVYVLPAKYEPFGLSVLEAALSGCALVLGKTDSLQEIWGDSALYVDTDDAHALARTLNHLMEDETLRTGYAERAKERAARYTTTAMAESYLQVYLQLPQSEKMRQQPEMT